jgi:hypothetical protein
MEEASSLAYVHHTCVAQILFYFEKDNEMVFAELGRDAMKVERI